MEKIGILGGTFDPPHIGHVSLAEAAATGLELERIILIPTERPPHKPVEKLTPVEDRIEMLGLAFSGMENVEISRIETGADKTFYTVDTVEKLASELGGNRELFLLVGEDNLYEIGGWREPERIAALARIAVMTRHVRKGDLQERKIPLPTAVANRVVEVRMKPVPVSSTEIRSRIKAGLPVNDMIDSAVLEYIERKGLYRK